MSNPMFPEKKKINQNMVCWKFYPACKVFNFYTTFEENNSQQLKQFCCFPPKIRILQFYWNRSYRHDLNGKKARSIRHFTIEKNKKKRWYVFSYLFARSIERVLYMGCIKQKSAFEHVQNVQIQIILHMHRVLSGPMLSIHTFRSAQL